MKIHKLFRLGIVSGGFLLFFGVAGFTQAADVYHLEDNLYAIICEDGHIFSYQGSEDGLTTVVPALCEDHGGVANPGGGGTIGNATAAEATARRPATSAGSRPRERPAAAASSRAGERAATASSRMASGPDGSLYCWGRSCPAGSVAREIDKATPQLYTGVLERCDTGSGARPVESSEGTVMNCPLQRNTRGQIVEQRR